MNSHKKITNEEIKTFVKSLKDTKAFFNKPDNTNLTEDKKSIILYYAITHILEHKNTDFSVVNYLTKKQNIKLKEYILGECLEHCYKADVAYKVFEYLLSIEENTINFMVSNFTLEHSGEENKNKTINIIKASAINPDIRFINHLFTYKSRFNVLKALITLIKVQKIEIAKSLIKQRINLEEEKTDFGQTAMHIAAETGNIEIINFLIKMSPNLLKTKDKKDYTPLMTAAFYGNLEAVKLIAQNATQQDLEYAFLKAVYSHKGDYLEVIDYLVKEKKVNTNCTNTYKDNALYTIFTKKDIYGVIYPTTEIDGRGYTHIVPPIELVQKLLSEDCNPEQKNEHGESAAQQINKTIDFLKSRLIPKPTSAFDSVQSLSTKKLNQLSQDLKKMEEIKKLFQKNKSTRLDTVESLTEKQEQKYVVP